MVEITILGCGSSLGVPVVGCECKICTSSSIHNKRTRSSILISKNGKNILVDFGSDIRNQLLRENIKKIEYAILTHDHADHVCGMDDLRVFSRINGKALPLYSDENTINKIKNRYQYMIDENHITMNNLEDFESKITLSEIELQFFKQDHRNMDSLGIRIGDFVYSNDVIDYPEESKKYLKNAKYLLIECIDYKSTTAHSGLEQVIKWCEEFTPENVYLVNMNHNIDYYEIQKHLPDNIKPAYDGLKLQIKI